MTNFFKEKIQLPKKFVGGLTLELEEAFDVRLLSDALIISEFHPSTRGKMLWKMWTRTTTQTI